MNTDKTSSENESQPSCLGAVSRSTFYQGDCLVEMDKIADKGVDMILCDLPYGTTACKWDSVIPFEPLWKHYERIIKDNGAIVLTASQPFTSALVMSNAKLFRYEWIWNKKLAGNAILAKKQPLKIHENVLVFNSKIYQPQKVKGKMRSKMTGGLDTNSVETIRNSSSYCEENVNDEYYPTSIQEFTVANMRVGRLHPTQKPLDLMEYLIKTYTNEGETVLDNCMGSGTTGIACVNTNRNFIGIEKNDKYFEIAENRINGTEFKPNSFEKTENRGLFLF